MCERHFDRTQILTHWEHIIDGKVCQLEREKPKIKFDAVPYLNLPETDCLTTAAKKRAAKLRPEQKKRKQTHPKIGANEKVGWHFGIRNFYLGFFFDESRFVTENVDKYFFSS